MNKDQLFQIKISIKNKKIIKKTIKDDEDDLKESNTETKVIKGEDGSFAKLSKTTSKKVKKVKKRLTRRRRRWKRRRFK